MLYFAGGLGVVGMVGLQVWLWGGGGEEAKAAVEVTPAKAEVPNFNLPKEEPPPLPAKEELPDNPPPRGKLRSTNNGPKLPTQIAFAVQAQGEPEMGWFADGRRPHLAHGCALRPGASTIPAALETTIQSEVGGQAIATVTSDVLDADGVGRLLIPAGSKVVGSYKTDGNLDFQSRRLAFVWTEITMPDGEQLNLDNAAGMDVAGSMGVGGEVDTRWGELVATAALLTVFDGIQRGTVGSDPTMMGAMQESASRTTGRLGKEITGRILDWEPDILIRAGTRITISPRKTIQVC